MVDIHIGSVVSTACRLSIGDTTCLDGRYYKVLKDCDPLPSTTVSDNSTDDHFVAELQATQAPFDETEEEMPLVSDEKVAINECASQCRLSLGDTVSIANHLYRVMGDCFPLPYGAKEIYRPPFITKVESVNPPKQILYCMMKLTLHVLSDPLHDSKQPFQKKGPVEPVEKKGPVETEKQSVTADVILQAKTRVAQHRSQLRALSRSTVHTQETHSWEEVRSELDGMPESLRLLFDSYILFATM